MPEIFLVLTLTLVIIGEITYFGEQVRLSIGTTLLGLAAAFVQTLFIYEAGAKQVFGGSLSIDGFSLFFKLFFIFLAILSVVLVSQSEEITSSRRSEYCALILASTLAMCLVTSAADFVLIFLSLLFLNVMNYFLSAYGWRSILSTEAAVKYLAFGSVALALLLYAFAILFAYTHTLNLYQMHQALVAHPLPFQVMLVVFVLSLLAFSFQMGSFPMSLVTPDILEGSPTPVSAFLSLGARAAGFAIAIRFFIVVFAKPGDAPGQWSVLGALNWTEIISFLAALTMLVGSLLSFRQKGAKRLVGYLVVADTGYMLLGLLVLDEVGIAALLYHLVIELFALMGSFYVLAYFYDELKTDRLVDLKGMLKRAVPECICLILFLFCLVGSPPTPGFIGKFALIGVAIRHHHLVLAWIGMISMVIATGSVLRLAFHLVGDFKDAVGSPLKSQISRKAILTLLIVPLVFVGIFADFVLRWAGQSLGFIFW